MTAIEDVTDVKRAEFAQRLLARTGELVAARRSTTSGCSRGHRSCSSPSSPTGARSDAARRRHDRAAGRSRTAIPSELARCWRAAQRYPTHVSGDSPGAPRPPHRRAAARRAGRRQAMRDVASDERARWSCCASSASDSAMIVPMMLAGGTSRGRSRSSTTTGSRRFGDDDLELAHRDRAGAAAVAIEGARIADERARVADALQRELLPPSLPRMPGWELATMYEPAGELNEVGGDFYEVFRVEDGWAVVLGDVSGRGAAAASLTAEARHTIRAAGGARRRSPCRAAGSSTRTSATATTRRSARSRCSSSPTTRSRARSSVFLAGHPHPLLIRGGSVETSARRARCSASSRTPIVAWPAGHDPARATSSSSTPTG